MFQYFSSSTQSSCDMSRILLLNVYVFSGRGWAISCKPDKIIEFKNKHVQACLQNFANQQSLCRCSKFARCSTLLNYFRFGRIFKDVPQKFKDISGLERLLVTDVCWNFPDTFQKICNWRLPFSETSPKNSMEKYKKFISSSCWVINQRWTAIRSGNPHGWKA